MVDYNVQIRAQEGSCAFVDKHDDGEVWLSIQTTHGSANCILDIDGARKMVEALLAVIKGEENGQ